MQIYDIDRIDIRVRYDLEKNKQKEKYIQKSKKNKKCLLAIINPVERVNITMLKVNN